MGSGFKFKFLKSAEGTGSRALQRSKIGPQNST